MSDNQRAQAALLVARARSAVDRLLRRARTGAGGSISSILRTNIGIQVLSFVSVPILTRIYGPEQYGLFALFSTLLGYLTQCCFLRYDMAVDLPKRDEDAVAILHFCTILTGGVATTATLVIVLFGDQVGAMFDHAELVNLLVFLPLALVLGVYGTMSGVWFARERNFRTTSNFRLAAAMTDVAAKLSLGASGLVKLGQVIGSLTSMSLLATLFIWSSRRRGYQIFANFDFRRALIVAWEYRKFPLLSFPATILETTAFAIPAVMIGHHFGPAAVGLYYAADRLTQAPAVAIASAIRPVFKRSAAIQLNEHGSCRPLLVKTLLLTAAIAAVAVVGLIVFSPMLFAWVFDPRWAAAVPIVQILAVARAMDIFVNPVTPIFLVRQSHITNLIVQALLVAGAAAAFALGGALGSLQASVALYTGVLCLKYVAELYFCYTFSKGRIGDDTGAAAL